jgi:hypothetical protein
MGRAARAKVEAEFTMQGLVRGLEELLEAPV